MMVPVGVERVCNSPRRDETELPSLWGDFQRALRVAALLVAAVSSSARRRS
ncbi:hypothetical protein GTA28_28820 [Rhodococcus hoagii]|nr:hypothetical protein [Prescottella equi]